jgi:hypothetical protein
MKSEIAESKDELIFPPFLPPFLFSSLPLPSFLPSFFPSFLPSSLPPFLPSFFNLFSFSSFLFQTSSLAWAGLQCLSLLSAGITDVQHHAWLYQYH